MSIIFNTPDEKEPEYDSPNGSKWIIGVADDGSVTVLMAPNIHYSFTDDGIKPENLGFPEYVEDDPGIYKWTCDLEQHVDWESSNVDDWNFYPVEIELLYTWHPDGKINQSGNKEA